MRFEMLVRKKICYPKLKAFFAEHGIRQDIAAKTIGTSRPKFNQKLNLNTLDFTLAEVRTLCENYDLDLKEYFIDGAKFGGDDQ